MMTYYLSKYPEGSGARAGSAMMSANYFCFKRKDLVRNLSSASSKWKMFSTVHNSSMFH